MKRGGGEARGAREEAGGRKRQRVEGEREGPLSSPDHDLLGEAARPPEHRLSPGRGGAAEGGSSAEVGGLQQSRICAGKASRFRGVSKQKRGKTPKPWLAQIYATKDSKGKSNYIGTFAREEDAARAYDRVKIAKLGHAKAETNFPVAEYRAEWAELEALGVDGAVALIKEQAAAERRDKTSRFRGVTKVNGGKGAKPWAAQIKVTENGEKRRITIGYFAREEDAARAYDRVKIAKLGHAEAETNFPVAEYRAEWTALEALGVEGAVASERRRAQQVFTAI